MLYTVHMSETQTVLYRKYRPKNFNEVFGQEHIVKVLKGSIEQNNIGHAYIFSGTRGTGKTTMARIFGKAIGCSDNDIIEIDAASNRGIDDIRALRESVASLPFDSDKKIYIIDEVHMLTKEAFNALLKTLEEPPEYVVFILATTELHKVLPTIVSRCQLFNFKSPSTVVLKNMLKSIIEQEGYTAEPDVLSLIASLGNGSFRDTQGVLQKIMSYSDDTHLSVEEVHSVVAAPDTAHISSILQALHDCDTDSLLKTLHECEEHNIDPHVLVHMVAREVRCILKIRYASSQHKAIINEIGEEHFNHLKTYSDTKNIFSADTLLAIIESYRTVGHAFIPYAALELAFLKIIANNSSQ